MNDTEKVTIMMLNNIIKNIEAGNITTVDREGEEPETGLVVITLSLRGEPDLTI